MSKYYALLNDRDTLFNFLEVLLGDEVSEFEPLEEEKIKSRISKKIEECNILIDEYVRVGKEKGVKVRDYKRNDMSFMEMTNKAQLKRISHSLDKRMFEFRKRLEKLQEV